MARTDQPETESLLGSLLSANDLQRLVAHHELEEMASREHTRSTAAEEKKMRMDLLRQRRDLTPAMIEMALSRWQNAARQGATEVELIRFPSELCTDDGRAVNNSDAGWGSTLTGVPAQIYEIWEKHLKPRGYRLKAYVVEFPDGKPGDIGLFLTWG